MNFQAAVSATVAVNILVAEPLRWLEGLVHDVPKAFSSETGGSGDDIRIELADGQDFEAQVKLGLRADNKLWVAIARLAAGIEEKATAFGVLVVSPSSSQTIRGELAQDLRRIGDGRRDGLSPIGRELVDRLRSFADMAAIARRLRIVTSSSVPDDDAHISRAMTQLGSILLDPRQADAAWYRLDKDASALIGRGGRRTANALMTVLESSGIFIRTDANGPASAMARLRDCQIRVSSEFSVLGFPKLLSLERAWLPLRAEVTKRERVAGALAEVVAQYHGEKRRNSGDEVDAATIGRFVRHGVVVGGPGLGKSTLLRRLGLTYSRMGLPVLIVRLQEVAIRMRQIGATFLEAILALGTKAPGIDVKSFGILAEMEPVFLCDGLDECEGMQERVAEALKELGASNPRARIIVATRPVGYETALLSKWRHYELMPLDWYYVANHIETLLEAANPSDDILVEELSRFAADQLEQSPIRSIAARTPLILGLCASLAMKRIAFGKSKAELYGRLFDLTREVQVSRPEPPFLHPRKADAVIDYLGMVVVTSPLLLREVQTEQVAALLSAEFGLSVAAAKVEVDQYIEYWEHRGLLETLSHGGERTVSFIHRSFGEFAAARAQLRLGTDQAVEFVERHLRNRGLGPVFEFVSGMSGWSLIKSATLRHRADSDFSSLLARLIETGSVAPNGLAKDDLMSIAQHAVPFLFSPVREEASEVGDALWKVGAAHPNVFEPYLSELKSSEHAWTQLIGWNLQLLAPNCDVDIDSLRDMFLRLPHLISPVDHGISFESGHLVLGDRGFGDVVSSFVTGALPRIIESGIDAEKLCDILSRDLGLSSDGTSKVEEILKAAALHQVRERVQKRYRSSLDLLKHLPETRTAHLNVLRVLQQVLPPPTESPPPVENGDQLFHVGAFLSATGYMGAGGKEGLSDLDVDSPSVSEVFRAAVSASELDTDTLSLEVAALRRTLEREGKDGWPTTAFYGALSLVDADANWDRLKGLPLDDRLLELAFGNAADWIVQMAANALYVRLADEAVEDFVQRVLAEYSGKGLWAVSIICTERLPRGRAAELLVARVRDGKSTGGLAYVAKRAAHVVEPKSTLALELVEAGLMRHGPYTAAEVAELVDTKMPWSARLEDIVRRAYERWLSDEEPYPKEGGRVPQSPRETLLRVLHRHVKFSLQELLRQAHDARSDVASFGTGKLVEHLRAAPDARGTFVDAVLASAIEMRLVTSVLRANLPWTPGEAERLCDYLARSSIEGKRGALILLKQGYVPPTRAAEALTALLKDESFDVRQAALRISAN